MRRFSTAADDRLTGEVVATHTVLEEDIRFIFDTLYEPYYAGVTYGGYFRDNFLGRPAVILLRDSKGVIRGFSLQQFLEYTVQGKECLVLWAGDINVHPDFWGKHNYRATLAGLCRKLYDENPDKLVYRVSTPKGYKTYRVNQSLFHKFYPSPDYNYYPEFEGELVDQVVLSKYPVELYDRTTRVLQDDHSLSDGYAAITEKQLQDPFIKCFVDRCPGWAKGQEIPVVAPIHPDNIKEQK